MTIKEAAQTINCSPCTLFNYVKMGKLAATYNGKDFDIDFDDLLDVFHISKETHQARNATLRDETLDEMPDEVSNLDGYILSLTRQIQEGDEQIQELHQVITRQQKAIRQLAEQLDFARQVIEEMQNRKSLWQRILGRIRGDG
ncbi:hypothetical protein HYR99_41330 [Candidatus Poribacteria bacterium]|nr:hypothetical protein [Candidatus Poribacteria bacterium]